MGNTSKETANPPTPNANNAGQCPHGSEMWESLLVSSVKDHFSTILLLGELGIKAGQAGKPVGLTLRDFPAEIQAEIWKLLTYELDHREVMNVFSQADLGKALNGIEKIRAVIMHSTRSWNFAVENLVELRRATKIPLPVVLSCYKRQSIESPGATLLVTYQSECKKTIEEMLIVHHDSRQCEGEEREGKTNDKETSIPKISTRRLMRAISGVFKTGSKLSLRNYKILDGLITGAVLKSFECTQEENVEKIEATPEHYKLVRALLSCSLLENIHAQHDQLTLTMLKRANLYLATAELVRPKKPKFARDGDTSTTSQNQVDRHAGTITRRELTELGNLNSKTLKDLVGYAVKCADKSALKSLGLPAPLIESVCNGALADNCKLTLSKITSWTEKQIRTRFDRLKKDGLVDSQRPVLNGPIQYPIPTELADQRSPFVNLPHEDELIPYYQALS